MSICSDYNVNLKKELENKFLYDNDLNSLYLFLTLIENEYRFNGLKPKYISVIKIKNKLNYLFFQRDDKELISSAVMKLINDDINKLELAIYLDAYSMGYENLDSVNKLEVFLLNYMNLDSFKIQNKLYNYNKNPIIKRKKKHLISNVLNRNYYNYLDKFIENYCEKIILKKVMNLNKHLNKQLTFKYKNSKVYIIEEKFLTKFELFKIYENILYVYKRCLKKISYDAVWIGLNDKLVNRYQ